MSNYSAHEIKKYLNVSGVKLNLFETVTSTNTVLRKMAEDGAEEKTVVISQAQTSGRGRRGRSFYSPSDSGLYMSVLLRPDIKISDAILVTTCAAVAVCRAIESVCNKKAEIKWVNDIYLDGKKVCGILTEAAVNVESGKAKYIILGIGINLTKPKNDFPNEIKNIVTTLFDNILDAENNKSRIAALILNNFFKEYCFLAEKRFFDEYKNRMFLTGKPIRVLSAEEYDAQVLGLDEDFSLIVKDEKGEIKKLNSGEVSTRAC